MPQIMTRELARFIIDQATEQDRAKLFQNSTQKPYHFSQLVQLLDTAQLSTDPLKIGFPFKAVTVLNTTDSITSINMRIGSNDDLAPLIALKQNNTLNFDEPVNEAYISWTAQAGKSITLLFAIDCVMNIGVATTAITGGIFQQDGTAVAAISQVTMVAATAIKVFATLSTRKCGTLVNNTGATIYVGGDNTVTAGIAATGGIPVPAGAVFNWRNTSALWAISTLGGVVNVLEES